MRIGAAGAARAGTATARKAPWEADVSIYSYKDKSVLVYGERGTDCIAQGQGLSGRTLKSGRGTSGHEACRKNVHKRWRMHLECGRCRKIEYCLVAKTIVNEIASWEWLNEGYGTAEITKKKM
jgi:hypothetical protein